MFPRTGTIPDINQKVSCHVETVVLLSQLKQKPDDYINVTIELDDVDITSAETKATTVPEDKESAIVEALKRFKMIQQE